MLATHRDQDQRLEPEVQQKQINQIDKLERVRTLGWVDFNRNSEQILIDLGVVSEAALSTAVAPRKGEHWQQAWALRSLIH